MIFLKNTAVSSELKTIAQKVFDGKRITTEEGITLYEQGELGFLGSLANQIGRASCRERV